MPEQGVSDSSIRLGKLIGRSHRVNHGRLLRTFKMHRPAETGPGASIWRFPGVAVAFARSVAAPGTPGPKGQREPHCHACISWATCLPAHGHRHGAVKDAHLKGGRDACPRTGNGAARTSRGVQWSWAAAKGPHGVVRMCPGWRTSERHGMRGLVDSPQIRASGSARLVPGWHSVVARTHGTAARVSRSRAGCPATADGPRAAHHHGAASLPERARGMRADREQGQAPLAADR